MKIIFIDISILGSEAKENKKCKDFSATLHGNLCVKEQHCTVHQRAEPEVSGLSIA